MVNYDGVDAAIVAGTGILCVLKPEVREQVLACMVFRGELSPDDVREIQDYIAKMTPHEKVETFVDMFILAGGDVNAPADRSVLEQGTLPELLPAILTELGKKKA